MKQKNDDQRALTILGLRIAGGLAAAIAIPVVVLVSIAHRLDAARAGPKPVFTIAAMFASFVISTIVVCMKAVTYGGLYLDMTEGDEERGPPGHAPESER